MDDIEQIDKMTEVASLFMQARLGRIGAYFDLDSTEMLDDKIRILREYIDGKAPDEIDGFYTIFELLPPDGDIWD